MAIFDRNEAVNALRAAGFKPKRAESVAPELQPYFDACSAWERAHPNGFIDVRSVANVYRVFRMNRGGCGGEAILDVFHSRKAANAAGRAEAERRGIAFKPRRPQPRDFGLS